MPPIGVTRVRKAHSQNSTDGGCPLDGPGASHPAPARAKCPRRASAPHSGAGELGEPSPHESRLVVVTPSLLLRGRGNLVARRGSVILRRRVTVVPLGRATVGVMSVILTRGVAMLRR